MLLLDGLEQLQTVQLAALKPDIQKDEAGPARDNRRQRVIAVTRCSRDIALILKDTRHQIADIGFVVDDEDLGRHGATRLLLLIVLIRDDPACRRQQILCAPRRLAGPAPFHSRRAVRCCRHVPR